MRRRLLPLTLLCAGTSLSTQALADNFCLLNGDPQVSFPGTNNPDVYGVTAPLEPGSSYGLYICAPADLDISWLTAYTFGDFNHDGFEDIAFGRSYHGVGGVELFLNDKTGSGTAVFDTLLFTGAAAAPSGVQVLDLDGNGWDDILTANGSDGTFTVMLNSRGNFNSVTQYAVASDVALLAAADVNSDGFPDVVTESATDQSVSVSLNKGDGHPDIYVSTFVHGGSAVFGAVTGTPGSQKFINNGDGTFTASAWQPATGGSSAGGSVSISGAGVTVTAGTGVGLLGGAGSVATLPVSVLSGNGQIKLPTITKVTVVTKSGSTGKTTAGTGSTGGSTKSGAAASSGGGGVMEWLSLMLLGLASLLSRKQP